MELGQNVTPLRLDSLLGAHVGFPYFLDFVPWEAWSCEIMPINKKDFLSLFNIATSFSWIAELCSKGKKDVANALN